MSRSGYTYEIDGWDLIRWRGAVQAAIKGIRGQELLHGLASALDMLPTKRLISHHLIDEDGQVCALGALGVACGSVHELRCIDSEDYELVAWFFGVANALVREIQYVNDERAWGETPEQRWTRMRAWIADQIIKEAAV